MSNEDIREEVANLVVLYKKVPKDIVEFEFTYWDRPSQGTGEMYVDYMDGKEECGCIVASIKVHDPENSFAQLAILLHKCGDVHRNHTSFRDCELNYLRYKNA